MKKFNLLFTGCLLLSILIGCSDGSSNDQFLQAQKTPVTEISTATQQTELVTGTQEREATDVKSSMPREKVIPEVAQDKKSATSASTQIPKKSDASLLIKLIKAQQLNLVKESYGEEAYQCFTDIDLEEFKATRQEQKAVQNIETDQMFKAKILPAINILSDEEWLDLRTKAKSTRRRTWAEIGFIDSKGQTDAGSTAETNIAKAIVEYVESQR